MDILERAAKNKRKEIFAHYMSDYIAEEKERRKKITADTILNAIETFEGRNYTVDINLQ